jgi:Putative transposase
VASSNHRISTRDDGTVTFQSKDSATDHTQASTVTAEACLRRVLQHVLPDRCINVRDDGVLRPGNRQVRAKVSTVLGASTVDTTTTGQPPDGTEPTPAREGPRCPQCGSSLILVATLRPRRRWPP